MTHQKTEVQKDSYATNLNSLFVFHRNSFVTFLEQFYCFYAPFQVDITQHDWLQNSEWDRDKENVILIHGYGGSVDALPMSVLRDGK